MSPPLSTPTEGLPNLLFPTIPQDSLQLVETLCMSGELDLTPQSVVLHQGDDNLLLNQSLLTIPQDSPQWTAELFASSVLDFTHLTVPYLGDDNDPLLDPQYIGDVTTGSSELDPVIAQSDNDEQLIQGPKNKRRKLETIMTMSTYNGRQ